MRFLMSSGKWYLLKAGTGRLGELLASSGLIWVNKVPLPPRIESIGNLLGNQDGIAADVVVVDQIGLVFSFMGSFIILDVSFFLSESSMPRDILANDNASA